MAVQSLSYFYLPHHGLQPTRLPCPSSSPGVYSNSCPLSQCCHPTISSSVPTSPVLNLSQHQGFSNESALHTEKAMAPHSSTVAWKIPWTEEPGGLQSMGSQSRTRLSDFIFTFHFHALEKEMATHSSVLAWRIPGMGELVSCRL